MCTISLNQIYQTIYGSAPTGPVTLAQLVAASNLSDKTAPHTMQSFCGYVHQVIVTMDGNPTRNVDTSGTYTDNGVAVPAPRYTIGMDIGQVGVGSPSAITINYTQDGLPKTRSIPAGRFIEGWWCYLKDNTGIRTFTLQAGTGYVVGSPTTFTIDTGTAPVNSYVDQFNYYLANNVAATAVTNQGDYLFYTWLNSTTYGLLPNPGETVISLINRRRKSKSSTRPDIEPVAAGKYYWTTNDSSADNENVYTLIIGHLVTQ